MAILALDSASSPDKLDGQPGSLAKVFAYIFGLAGWEVVADNPGAPQRLTVKMPSGEYYLDVDDTGAALATPQDALVRGYKSMTTFGTGTDPFPTVAQLTNGYYVRKSTTADDTAREWRAWIDDRTFHFYPAPGGLNEGRAFFYFGEIFSFTLPSDPYNCLISARIEQRNFAGDMLWTESNGSLPAAHMARSWDGSEISSPVASTKHMYMEGFEVGSGQIGSFPNIPDGKLYMVTPYIIQFTAPRYIRGRLRGVHWVLHDCKTHVTDLDSLQSGDREFLFLKRAPGADLGVYCQETTEWETNS